jgi:ribonuclease III
MSSYPIPMNAAKISAVEVAIGHKFADFSTIWEALQAAGSGVLRIGSRRIVDGNKTLALVGDAALKLLMIKEGYEEGTGRGAINDAVSGTGSNANLARIGFAKGLDLLICMNPSHIGPVTPSMMATSVQAILGAVYLDCGLELNGLKHVMTTLGLSGPR